MILPDPGVLVVNRLSYFRMLSKRAAFASRTASCALSSDEIVKSYRGLEGDAWPDDDKNETLVPIGKQEGIWRDLERTSSQCDMVVLSTRPIVDPTLVLLGFEVGYFESKYSHFSSVFHEVLFGVLDPMRQFGKILNHSLLFSTEEQASQLLALREGLLATGADLESGGPSLDIIRIHGKLQSS